MLEHTDKGGKERENSITSNKDTISYHSKESCRGRMLLSITKLHCHLNKKKMKLYVNQNIPVDNNCYNWWMVALIPLEMEMLELHKEQFATRD